MKWTEEQLRQVLCRQMEQSGSVRRKKLIEDSMLALGFSEEQLRDFRPESESVQLKISLGTLLTELIHAGQMREDEVGILHMVENAPTRYSAVQIRSFITDTLAAGGTLGKRRLFTLAEQHFGTDRTQSRNDDNALRSVMGRMLLELEKEGHIRRSQRGYEQITDGDYPSTELGGYLRQAAHGGDIRHCFLEALHTKGGEWFEYYCVNLLKKYYEMSGKRVDEGYVTGGSEDGGIDGIIHTTDDLGYRETVLMQMKNRHAVMNEKDLREFYGAVCAENGSRGIFITLSSFHPMAWKFIEKVDNLTGMDGERLFEIAKKCGLGLLEKNGKTVIDEKFLLEDRK